MSVSPLISVVMPAYNSEAHISEAIKSVVTQTYKNIELLVVDGGSTDRTELIVSKFSEGDNRVKLIHNLYDQGPAHARSTAIRCASGEYIAFIDSDDLWLECKLEIQMAHILAFGSHFSYGYYREMSSDGKSVGPLVPMYDSYDYPKALGRRGIGTLTVVIKRSRFTDDVLNLWKKSGGEDYIWWLMILKSGIHATCCATDLARYRDTENSLSKNRLYTLKSVWDMYVNALGIPIFSAILYYSSYVIDSGFRKAYLLIMKLIAYIKKRIDAFSIVP